MRHLRTILFSAVSMSVIVVAVGLSANNGRQTASYQDNTNGGNHFIVKKPGNVWSHEECQLCREMAAYAEEH